MELMSQDDVKSRILHEARSNGSILRCSEVVIARCQENVAKPLLITGRARDDLYRSLFSGD